MESLVLFFRDMISGAVTYIRLLMAADNDQLSGLAVSDTMLHSFSHLHLRLCTSTVWAPYYHYSAGRTTPVGKVN